MTRDELEGALEQFLPGRNLVPGRHAGRMRQRDEIERVSGAFDSKFAANHPFQIRAIDELSDGQSADRNDKTWAQDFDLIVHPERAVKNFFRRRHAIAAAGSFSRETSTYRREINSRSKDQLVQSAEFFKPTKKRFASGVCKRFLQDRFSRPRRLTNQHHIANNGATRDRRRLHARTASTFPQMRDVIFESTAAARDHDSPTCGKSKRSRSAQY